MSSLSSPVTAEDHSSGDSEAKYTLVEYGDLQCPDTAAAEPEISEIAERFTAEFRLVYRHFPLTDIHAFAYHASLAVEAAARQGKFWEMRTLLLEHQDQLTDADLIEYANRLGLDTDKFKSDLTDKQLAHKIDGDIQTGSRSGVDSTPTFFLNGRMLDPGLDLFEVFESLHTEKDRDGDDEDDEDRDGDDEEDEEDEEY